jgi:hypothetical protein
MDVKGQRVLTPPRRRRVGARRGRAGELAGPSFSRRRSRSPTHLFRLKPAPMSSHGHSHDHGRGHSHAEPSHSHSHDGVECAGHDATLPTEAELAAQKQERLAFDRVVASFYNYEPHSVRSLAMASLGSRQSLRPSAFTGQLSANHRRLKDLLCASARQAGGAALRPHASVRGDELCKADAAPSSYISVMLCQLCPSLSRSCSSSSATARSSERLTTASRPMPPSCATSSTRSGPACSRTRMTRRSSR